MKTHGRFRLSSLRKNLIFFKKKNTQFSGLLHRTQKQNEIYLTIKRKTKHLKLILTILIFFENDVEMNDLRFSAVN